MDYNKIGAAIAYLRKRAGFTQKELALRIGISDKAVSKWERGLTLPDVSCLTKLSILLDTDTDSLLAGDVINHDHGWCGLLVLDEDPYGIYAGTMVFDKPLVYFLLSYFILVGIKTVFVVCPERDRAFIEQRLAGGQDLGMHIHFCGSALSDTVFAGAGNVMAVFGREFIYGVDQTRFFKRAMVDRERTTILSLPKRQSGASPKIGFDNDKKIVDYEDGDRLVTQYDYFGIPVLFCPVDKLYTIYENGKLSISGEDILYTEVLDRGYIEMALDTWEDVLAASELVRIIQKACGMQLYSVEEIAWRRGFITDEKLTALAEASPDPAYRRYLLGLIG